MLKVVVPQIQVNGVPGRCMLTPKFASRKAYGVDVLAILALDVCIGIGKGVDTVIARDGTYLASRVTRESCVPRRVDVASADAFTDLETRGHFGIVT
jgi:hypothetical protein